MAHAIRAPLLSNRKQKLTVLPDLPVSQRNDIKYHLVIYLRNHVFPADLYQSHQLTTMFSVLRQH